MPWARQGSAAWIFGWMEVVLWAYEDARPQTPHKHHHFIASRSRITAREKAQQNADGPVALPGRAIAQPGDENKKRGPPLSQPEDALARLIGNRIGNLASTPERSNPGQNADGPVALPGRRHARSLLRFFTQVVDRHLRDPERTSVRRCRLSVQLCCRNCGSFPTGPTSSSLAPCCRRREEAMAPSRSRETTR
jgi:hypothetical protein